MADHKIKLDPGAAALLDALHGAGYAAYAVGGCVRDSLSGSYAPRLGPLHQRSAPAGAGSIRERAVHPNGFTARHRDGQIWWKTLRDDDFPHRGQLLGWPPPGFRGFCAGRERRPGPAGFYHQRHGLQRRGGAYRPLWRAERPGPGPCPGCGRAPPALYRGCPPHPAALPVRGAVWL